MADAREEMRHVMAEYARAMRPDPGLRARVGAQVENRGRRREPARWAPLAAAVVALLLITTFMLVRQSTNRQPASTPTFTSFTTPSRGSMPAAIVAGPDGAMWFAETSVARIGRIDEGGTAGDYPLSDPNAARPRLPRARMVRCGSPSPAPTRSAGSGSTATSPSSGSRLQTRSRSRSPPAGTGICGSRSWPATRSAG